VEKAVARTMASDEDPLDAVLAAMMQERPCISDAMKNVVSVLASKDIVSAAVVDATPPAASHTTGPSHNLGHLLAIAKCILKATNEHMLLSPAEWAVAHPQGEEESGASRIDALTNYKASFALVAEARSKPGAKVTKLLGRSLLRHTRCWEDALRERCASELAALRYPPSTVDAFLNAWGDSLWADADSELQLVWEVDLQAALQARQRVRQQEVAERLDRMESSQSEADALRAALAGAETGAEAAAPEGMEDEPRLVEVPQ